MDERQQAISAELGMQQEEHQFQLKMQEQQHSHENELKNKEIGFLGKFFGSSDNAAKNMAFTVILLVVLGATVFSICILFNSTLDNSLISKVWNSIVPIITLALGYIFGKNND